jgi:hypothetical protein
MIAEVQNADESESNRMKDETQMSIRTFSPIILKKNY